MVRKIFYNISRHHTGDCGGRSPEHIRPVSEANWEVPLERSEMGWREKLVSFSRHMQVNSKLTINVSFSQHMQVNSKLTMNVSFSRPMQVD